MDRHRVATSAITNQVTPHVPRKAFVKVWFT